MNLNLFKRKQQNIDNFKTNAIQYVAKFGNGIISNVKAFYSVQELNSFKFPDNCTIIEVYEQLHSIIHQADYSNINEADLVLKARLFRGEYVPFLEAQEFYLKNKLNLLKLNKNCYSIYNSLIKEMIQKEESGIILCNGVPHLALEDKTYHFHLNLDGQIDKIAPIQGMELSASEKYSQILKGNPIYLDKMIDKKTSYRIKGISDIIQK